MNKLLVLLFLFSAGSVTGWVIELFFRRFLDPVESKKKKWVNPGFFVGPYLPIYGSGLIVLYLLGHIHIPAIGAEHPILLWYLMRWTSWCVIMEEILLQRF